MLGVLRGVSQEGELFSPMNSLMNSFLDETNEEKAINTTCDQLSEWLFLGSPVKIMQHLADADALRQSPLRLKSDLLTSVIVRAYPRGSMPYFCRTEVRARR